MCVCVRGCAQATSKRSELLAFIQEQAGVATLLDVRRSEAYDAGKTVDALLDSADVRAWMGATSKVCCLGAGHCARADSEHVMQLRVLGLGQAEDTCGRSAADPKKKAGSDQQQQPCSLRAIACSEMCRAFLHNTSLALCVC